MKNWHLSIIIISLILIGASNFNIVQDSNEIGGVAIPQISTSKSNFTDGDIIPINGYALPNSTTNIFLVNNYGNIQNSTQVKSNNTGYFNTSLGIPSHVIGGAWALFAKSGESNFAMQLMVNFHGSNTPPFNFPSGLLPLKQFKLGIESHYVRCYNDLSLVIKKENGSPACVKPDTAHTLIFHGWASSMFGISFEGGRTFVIPDILAAYVPCTTSYLQSNTDVTVLYMPANSIGKICLRYSNINDTPETISAIRIFDPNNSYQNVTSVKIWNNLENNYTIPKGDSNVVYWIQTGNQTGFYGLDLYCGGVPFVIGYDNNSSITSSDFPFLGVTHSCPIMSYGVNIEGLTGIGVKYVPYP